MARTLLWWAPRLQSRFAVRPPFPKHSWLDVYSQSPTLLWTNCSNTALARKSSPTLLVRPYAGTN